MKNLILVYPDLNRPYIAFTKASKNTCSAVLAQENTTSTDG